MNKSERFKESHPNYHNEYYAKNSKRIRERQAKWASENCEKIKLASKKFIESNPDKIMVGANKREIQYLATDNNVIFQVKFKFVQKIYDIEESKFDELFELWNKFNEININGITTYYFL